MALTVHFNYKDNWTALFCIGELTPSPPQLDKSERLYKFRNSSGYDGQFYHDLAHDPMLTHGSAPYIDAPRFRQRRILLPALAWVFAFGQQQWIDRSYFATLLAFLAAGVYWLSRYSQALGRNPWWGLLYLAVPSTIISIDRMTTDLAFVSLFMGFVYFIRRDSLRTLWIIAAAACLTRETGLCIVAGYTAHLLWRRQFRTGAIFATSAVPFFAWYAFITLRTPGGDQSIYPFHYPGRAIFEAILHPNIYPVSPTLQTILTAFDLTSLFAFLAILVLACAMLRRDPALGSIAISFVTLALFSSSLNGTNPVFTEVYSYGRVFSPVLLAIAIDALTRRSTLVFSLFAIVSLRSMLMIGVQALGILRAVLR
jgi:hypothetical protein